MYRDELCVAWHRSQRHWKRLSSFGLPTLIMESCYWEGSPLVNKQKQRKTELQIFPRRKRKRASASLGLNGAKSIISRSASVLGGPQRGPVRTYILWGR